MEDCCKEMVILIKRKLPESRSSPLLFDWSFQGGSVSNVRVISSSLNARVFQVHRALSALTVTGAWILSAPADAQAQ